MRVLEIYEDDIVVLERLLASLVSRLTPVVHPSISNQIKEAQEIVVTKVRQKRYDCEQAAEAKGGSTC